MLADPGFEDPPKLDAITRLLATCRLLPVFDDFEQYLAPGGQSFLDPAIDDTLTAWQTPPALGRCC